MKATKHQVKYMYTNDEGRRIAMEFAQEVLAECGRGEFSVIGLSGSISRGEKSLKDVDILVVGRGDAVIGEGHKIFRIASDYKEKGKNIDVWPFFNSFCEGNEFSKYVYETIGLGFQFPKYVYETIGLGFLKNAIPLYESPLGSLAQLKERFREKFNRQGVY